MALRNSLLKTGMFNNEKTAEEQVVGVLNFDIHIVKDFRGRRYIERITECIPIEDKNDYTFDHRKQKTGSLTLRMNRLCFLCTFSFYNDEAKYTLRIQMNYIIPPIPGCAIGIAGA